MPLGTISGLGVGSKLDLQGVLDKLRQVDDAAVTSLNNKKTRAQGQLAAFDAVNAKFGAVKTHALALSLETNFLTKQSTGMTDSIASATVALGTPDATHTVEVTRLATKSSFQSAGFATADAVVATAATTLAYRLGASGATVNVSVAANTTLTQLAEQINTAPDNPGITAAVVNTGIGATPFRLALRANSTGEANRIGLVTPLPDLALTEVQGAGGAPLNAALKVNGVDYERQSNSGITDVLPGVTLNLKGAGTTTFQITSDTSGIKDSVKSLVKAFQEAFQEVAAKTGGGNQTQVSGPLASSSALRGLRGELSTLLSSRVNTGGTITSLFDLGLEFTRDGSLSLDESKLTTALTDKPQEVKRLFVGQTGVTGLGTLLADKLTDVTRSSGLIATEKLATQNQVDRLETRITSAKARLDRRYDVLAQQFAALDTYAARQQKQGDFLGNMISSLNNTQKD